MDVTASSMYPGLQNIWFRVGWPVAISLGLYAVSLLVKFSKRRNSMHGYVRSPICSLFVSKCSAHTF